LPAGHIPATGICPNGVKTPRRYGFCNLFFPCVLTFLTLVQIRRQYHLYLEKEVRVCVRACVRVG
jgi:hypothetical protein